MASGVDDFLNTMDLPSGASNFGRALDYGGKILGGADLLYKTYKLGDDVFDGHASNEQSMNEWNAFAEVGISGFGFTPAGAVVGVADLGLETVTGKGVVAHGNDLGSFYGSLYAHLEYGSPLVVGGWDRGLCPEGGTRKEPPSWWDAFTAAATEITGAKDPNLIIGPDGQPDKKWVSVKDRLPYSILFENDSTATARARYIKITTPIEPKQDAATLELGSFGFNNQSFDIPPGTSSYYQRLDARDSTGLYVDIVAGYDVVNNQIFWELQGIDPITLLPPEDPLAGFLFLQDSTQPAYGNGFVNFSIKPITSAQTLDTIGARAFIVFDQNDTIPTNIHTNTIDAVSPTSQMNTLPANGTNPITLSWTGADDPNGSGIDYYTIYVSNDLVNYSVLIPRITGLDTTLSLPSGSNYCFFVLATDRTGNAETLRPGVIRCSSVGNPLPVTLLYFNGTNQDKNNLLKWGTASEQNSKEFRLERSLNGSDFNQITTVVAAGNSSIPRDYQYTDRNIDQINSNVMFYRLKQVDLDNNFKYSNIVRLNYNKSGVSNSIVYPNPTNGYVTVVLGDNSLLGTEALVTDVNGMLLQRVKFVNSSQVFNLSGFTNGLYLIRLSNKETLKVIKQ